jgi:hypothetical protein
VREAVSLDGSRNLAALTVEIDEAEQLSSDVKTKLKESILDIVVATPKTDTAIGAITC